MKNSVFIVALAASALTISAHAQTPTPTVVARYDFEDGVPSASVDTDPRSIASTFQSGAGITLTQTPVGDNTTSPFSTSTATGDTGNGPDSAIFVSSNANQTTQAGAVTNNDYLTFTLTPVANFSFTFTTLNFKLAQSGASYAEGYFVRTNQTGTTNIALGTFNTERTSDGAFQLITVDLTAFSQLRNVTVATEFRIYFYNPDGGSTTSSIRIDKVEVLAIPEPSTYAMIGLGAALLIAMQRFRRKS